MTTRIDEVRNKIEAIEKSTEASESALANLLMQICDQGKKTQGELREEREHAFEQELSLIAESQIKDIEERLKKILGKPNLMAPQNENEMHIEQRRFMAYYALHILYRRRWAYDDLKELTEAYKNDHFCKSHRIIAHLDVMAEQNIRENDEIRESLVIKANENCELFSHHAGVQHCFSNIVITYIELYQRRVGDFFYHDIEYDAFVEKWFPLAIERVGLAIELEKGFAKFYSTKARLLALQDKFQEAELYLNKARSLESKSLKYYSNRTALYERFQVQLEIKQLLYSVKPIRQQIGDFEEKLERSLHKNLEYLALFSAVISIIIGTISIAGWIEIGASALIGVIVALFGCVACSVSIFETLNLYNFFYFKISTSSQKPKRIKGYIGLYIGMFLLGIVGICLGYKGS